MTPTRDDEERARALRDLMSTLLVEASAGTGKTSLLAGRVVMLLADDKPPSSIAAITFTERAAAELRTRVERFADALIDGAMPDDLLPAFRTSAPSEEQKVRLRERKEQLGELTAGTIHAFCLSILQTYAVEARIDPGAVVMDAEQTDLAFASILDAWLNERLGDNADPNDPIVIMAENDPARAVRVLRELADFRRAHQTARPPPATPYGPAVGDFIEAVAEYRRWMGRAHAPDKAVVDLLALEDLANLLAPARSGKPSFGQLLQMLHPESPLLPARSPDFGDSRVLFAYRPRATAWGASNATGASLAIEDKAHYERCATLFGQALGALADALLGQYFDETDSLMGRFERYKANAAVLDFDDILIRTRALLSGNAAVRASVADRYRHVLVDEFQDTDPVQTDILFLICGDDDRALRPGALFLVGDPKQAIYRFRGADLGTYLRTRTTIAEQFPGNVLHIQANFRSEKRILAHVDRVFEGRLSAQLGDYSELEATIEDDTSLAVVKHSYPTQQTDNASVARQAEAKEIADLCAAIVGNMQVRRSDGTVALAEPGDIALLSPNRTQLWLYERALEDKGLPVASQAGKNLYRRQETQDLVALVRCLADNRDTLALGAVLRGPLVGFTEHELLDATQALRTHEPGAVLRLRKDPLPIADEGLRDVMELLTDLWRRRRGTTPHALLSEALDRLRALPVVASRSPHERSRALANVASLLERARSYHVRGLKQLAIDLTGEWDKSVAFDEAPADHPRDSIDIVTIHKAKGLEWPVVIPINLVSMWRRPSEFFHRADDDTLHWTLGDVASSSLAAAVAADIAKTNREYERLLYVASTRALDLLIIPDPSAPRTDSWFSFLDLGQEALRTFAAPAARPRPEQRSAANSQTASIFADEAAGIADASPNIVWRNPSRLDPEREMLDGLVSLGAADEIVSQPLPVVVGAGARRGVILHRLIEELIARLCAAGMEALIERASALLDEAPDDEGEMPVAEQLAMTAMSVFLNEELDPYRDKLLAEVPLFGTVTSNELISARADAIAIDEGGAIAAFDWKSDVRPTDETMHQHRIQLAKYLQLIGAPTGAVVYLTSNEFHWIGSDGRRRHRPDRR
ncbi:MULTISPECIES: exodeoxyribonuclease V subunit beta [unclassified Devosia]|uniref:UvrD-helicase domain-containing protein n=1 Tax=unclassified Devosia TaxID=196773 RepID=UPI00086A9576|nr:MULTISPECIES: UvrD-helicase domain-containing protein [unclassified Devosia]MBN9360885.1 UvrD-helicase domain-containing protein [Devosia sp.]ODS88140.1 MAG: hypothetical protein ABS47_10310 [Devosia sp. SCN 66-27]OJX22831.1 MAG: hypothetical protein BGO83_18840 [Devosia sp. 66-14]